MGFILFIFIFILVPILIKKKKEEEKSKSGRPENAPPEPERISSPREEIKYKSESFEEEYGQNEAPERTRAVFDGEGYDSGAIYDGGVKP